MRQVHVTQLYSLDTVYGIGPKEPPFNDPIFYQRVCIDALGHKNIVEPNQRFSVVRRNWEKEIKPRFPLVRLESMLDSLGIVPPLRNDQFFKAEFEKYFNDFMEHGKDYAMSRLGQRFRREYTGEGEKVRELESNVYTYAHKMDRILIKNKIKLN